MIYISTALYCEAKPFITRYGLKKTDQFHKFQVFLGDAVILIITGAGQIPSSVAIASVCTVFPPTEEDFYLSFGSSAALSKSMPIGELYLLNKITHLSADKTYYPDILFRHSFQETQGITGNKVLEEDSPLLDQSLTYDMEAASSYISASYFFGPHQMAFLRMISDYGTNRKNLASTIMALIESKTAVLFSFVDQLRNRKQKKSFALTIEAETFLKETAEQLHLSISMKYTLTQHVKFYLFMHGNLFPIITWCKSSIPDTCKSKREGKIYFEQLKRQLL